MISIIRLMTPISPIAILLSFETTDLDDRVIDLMPFFSLSALYSLYHSHGSTSSRSCMHRISSLQSWLKALVPIATTMGGIRSSGEGLYSINEVYPGI